MKYVKLDKVVLSYDPVSTLVKVEGITPAGKHAKYRGSGVYIHGSEMCMYPCGLNLKNPVDCEKLLRGCSPSDELGIECREIHFRSSKMPWEKIKIDDYSLERWDEIGSPASKMLIDDDSAYNPIEVGAAYKETYIADDGTVMHRKWRVCDALHLGVRWLYAIHCEEGDIKGKITIAEFCGCGTLCYLCSKGYDSHITEKWKEE